MHCATASPRNVSNIPWCGSAGWPTDGLQVTLGSGRRWTAAVGASGMGLDAMRPQACLPFVITLKLVSIWQPKEWRWSGFKGFTCHLPFPGPYFDWIVSPRSCRDALSKKCYRIHKAGQNKKQRHKKRTRDLWNIRRETQIQWTTPDSRNTPSPTNPG